jgi:hypothetical protein
VVGNSFREVYFKCVYGSSLEIGARATESIAASDALGRQLAVLVRKGEFLMRSVFNEVTSLCTISIYGIISYEQTTKQ